MKQMLRVIVFIAVIAGQSYIQAMGTSKQALDRAWKQGYDAAMKFKGCALPKRPAKIVQKPINPTGQSTQQNTSSTGKGSLAEAAAFGTAVGAGLCAIHSDDVE